MLDFNGKTYTDWNDLMKNMSYCDKCRLADELQEHVTRYPAEISKRKAWFKENQTLLNMIYDLTDHELTEDEATLLSSTLSSMGQS